MSLAHAFVVKSVEPLAVVRNFKEVKIMSKPRSSVVPTTNNKVNTEKSEFSINVVVTRNSRVSMDNLAVELTNMIKSKIMELASKAGFKGGYDMKVGRGYFRRLKNDQQSTTKKQTRREKKPAVSEQVTETQV